MFARACSWELEGAASDACKYSLTPPDVKMLYCETCRTDGCNGDRERSLHGTEVTTATTNTDSGAVSGLVLNRVMLWVVGLVAVVYGY